ncbi:MAG TPA: DUF1450 domain-containing protein [Negativicutes bacterium]|nr:DUF1450 domain-containing protein [Negativicutes bacterium]
MNTLKFCEQNLTIHEGMAKAVDKAKAEFANVDISTEPCLGECGQCAETPIAMANDQLISGDSSHVLFERAKNIIGEREVATPNKR